MFDVAPTELLLVAMVALIVIGPKDLPKAMRFVGYWVGRARGLMRQFRSGFDTMVREAELQEMEKRWAEENARIMREHQPTPDQILPLAAPASDIVEGEVVAADPAPVMVEQPVVLPAPDVDQPVADVPVKVAKPRKPRAKLAPKADS